MSWWNLGHEFLYGPRQEIYFTFQPKGDDTILDGHDGDVAAVRDEVGAHVVEDAVDVIRCQLVGGR
jgi:hypothetical protein